MSDRLYFLYSHAKCIDDIEEQSGTWANVAFLQALTESSRMPFLAGNEGDAMTHKILYLAIGQFIHLSRY